MKTKTRAPRQTRRVRLHRRMGSALEQLQRVELIRPLTAADPAYSFKHVLVQDTAQATLLRGDHRRLHRFVGEAYESIYADRCMDEFAGLLAQHFAAADDDAKTLLYATRAGDVAANAYAHVEAIAFYTLALDAAKRGGATTTQFIHLYTKRGRVLEVSGHDPDALASYQEMREYARMRGDRAFELQALLLQGKLHSAPSVVFDRRLAQALASEAELLATELGDCLAQAQINWNQLILEHYGGNMQDAIRYGEQAMALARDSEAPELLAYILGDLARAYLNSGAMERAATLHTQARALWRELDNKPMLADNLMMSATQAHLLGDYAQAVALSDEGIAMSQAIDSKLSLLSNQGLQQAVYLDRGEYARALQIATEMIRTSAELKLSFNAPLAYAQVAWTYGIIGAFERGEEMAHIAREILSHPLPEFFRAWGWVLLANFYLASEKPDAARGALAAARVEDVTWNIGPAGTYGIIALARYLYARGEFANAAHRMATRVQELRTLGIKQTQHEALFIQAQAVRALGDTALAFELVHRAREVGEGMQSRRVLWEIYDLLSQIESERGNAAQAKKYRAQARETIEFLAAHTPGEFRRGFLNLRRVREVLA